MSICKLDWTLANLNEYLGEENFEGILLILRNNQEDTSMVMNTQIYTFFKVLRNLYRHLKLLQSILKDFLFCFHLKVWTNCRFQSRCKLSDHPSCKIMYLYKPSGLPNKSRIPRVIFKMCEDCRAFVLPAVQTVFLLFFLYSSSPTHIYWIPGHFLVLLCSQQRVSEFKHFFFKQQQQKFTAYIKLHLLW